MRNSKNWSLGDTRIARTYNSDSKEEHWTCGQKRKQLHRAWEENWFDLFKIRVILKTGGQIKSIWVEF